MSRRKKKLPETKTPKKEKMPNPALDPIGFFAYKIKSFWKEHFPEPPPNPENQHKVNHDKNDKRP